MYKPCNMNNMQSRQIYKLSSTRVWIRTDQIGRTEQYKHQFIHKDVISKPHTTVKIRVHPTTVEDFRTNTRPTDLISINRYLQFVMKKKKNKFLYKEKSLSKKRLTHIKKDFYFISDKNFYEILDPKQQVRNIDYCTGLERPVKPIDISLGGPD